jgi:hypothetical protein
MIFDSSWNEKLSILKVIARPAKRFVPARLSFLADDPHNINLNGFDYNQTMYFIKAILAGGDIWWNNRCAGVCMLAFDNLKGFIIRR